jgi:hypothetical protein
MQYNVDVLVAVMNGSFEVECGRRPVVYCFGSLITKVILSQQYIVTSHFGTRITIII